MNPTDFLDKLDRLISNISRNKCKTLRTTNARNRLRSFVGAWFGVYRPSFITLIAEEKSFLAIDELNQKLLRLASENSSCRICKEVCVSIKKIFCDALLVPLSRAYWSHAPESAPAGKDQEVGKKLKSLDDDLAESYEQVVEDLMQMNRRTYRGTAAELREVLRGVLDRLAPDSEVKSADWFKQAKQKGTRKDEKPTMSEKTKFIMRKHGSGSAATEAAESYMSSVEERLGHVVRATYRRASNSTHSGAEREEILQQLRYANALLAELLPREA
jgi:hypothetical protein